jgi:hypothetical protein
MRIFNMPLCVISPLVGELDAPVLRMASALP